MSAIDEFRIVTARRGIVSLSAFKLVRWKYALRERALAGCWSIPTKPRTSNQQLPPVVSAI